MKEACIEVNRKAERRTQGTKSPESNERVAGRRVFDRMALRAPRSCLTPARELRIYNAVLFPRSLRLSAIGMKMIFGRCAI